MPDNGERIRRITESLPKLTPAQLRQIDDRETETVLLSPKGAEHVEAHIL
jgi:hypothetical protein